MLVVNLDLRSIFESEGLVGVDCHVINVSEQFLARADVGVVWLSEVDVWCILEQNQVPETSDVVKVHHQVEEDLSQVHQGLDFSGRVALGNDLSHSEDSENLEKLEILEALVNCSEGSSSHQRQNIEVEPFGCHVLISYLVAVVDFGSNLVYVAGEEHDDEVKEKDYINKVVKDHGEFI